MKPPNALEAFTKTMDEANTTLERLFEILVEHEVKRATWEISTGWYTVTPVGGRPKRAYISGAISSATGEGKARKLAKFAEAEAFLSKKGWAVVNPLNVQPCADASCVDRDGYAEPDSQDPEGRAHSWGCFMRNDIRALMECDVIVMIPGWEMSRGARAERVVARSVGMPCKYLRIEHLLDGAQSIANS